MLWLGLLLIGIGIGFLGCGILKTLGGEPVLGQYDYIHAVPHGGVYNREIPIWIDHDFGEADQIEIAKAVEQWNFVLNNYVHLVIVDTHFNMEISKITESVKTGGWLIMKLQSIDSLVPIPAEPGLWTLAFVEHIGGSHMYLVRDRLANEDIFGVTMHEIGHLLGSSHVGTRLMYYKFSRVGYQCVDHETAVAVAEHNGLAAEDLNYCVDRDFGTQVMKTPSTSEVEVSNCPLE